MVAPLGLYGIFVFKCIYHMVGLMGLLNVVVIYILP